MTALKLYTDDGLHEWTNLQKYHSSIPVVLRCGTSNLIPLCHYYPSTGEAVDDVIIEYLNGVELTLDDASDFTIETDGTYDWIIYNGETVESGAMDLDEGLARLRIEMDGATIFYSDYFEICDLEMTIDCGKRRYDNYFNLYFSDEHDLTEPYNIIYQTGYENHHAFNTLPVRPDSTINVEGETDEAQDEFITYQSQKKTYHVEIIGGESLFTMLSALPMHEYIYVSWPCVNLQQAKNIEFEYEWIEDFLCRMVISFTFDNLEVSKCCANESYEVEIIESSFDDWFLRSAWELYYMWYNLHWPHGALGSIGNFNEGYYWSSTENNATLALTIDFTNGSYFWNNFKSNVLHMRCARTFEDDIGAYQVRDRGPSGGFIFYIDGTTYYEACSNDCPDHEWSNVHNGLIGTTSADVGEGQNNTDDIIAQAGHTDSAANSCENL